MDLLHENGGPEDDVEFDFETGEFVEVIYTSPEHEPFRKKSTKFPQMENSPCLSALIHKVCENVDCMQID